MNKKALNTSRYTQITMIFPRETVIFNSMLHKKSVKLISIYLIMFYAFVILNLES